MAEISKARCPACKSVLTIESTSRDIRVRCAICGARLTIKRNGDAESTIELSQATAGPEPEVPYARPMPSSETEYRYSAFISYRHVVPDRRWAQWLHQRLETFRTPAALVRRRALARRLEPVFRDHDELPASSQLNDQIELALRRSRFLIVVCSPRTPGSKWVNREVELFRQLGRSDRILTLLVEGEPSDAFPRAFVEARSIDGSLLPEIEPIAADVRSIAGGPRRRIALFGASTQRRELLRIVASLLGVPFDDLVQRDRQRRRRFYRVTAALTSCLLVIFFLLGLRAWSEHRRAELAQQQTVKEAAQRKEAQEQAKLEAEQRKVAERNRLFQQYIADMRSLPQLWKDSRVDLIHERLNKYQVPAEADPRGFEWFYWKRLADSNAVRAQAPRRATSLAWSADSGTLFAADVEGQVVAWNAATGERRDISGADSGSLTVAADRGGRLALVSCRGDDVGPTRLSTIDVREAANAEPTCSAGMAGFPGFALAFSPDGQLLAHGTGAGEVLLLRSDTGELAINLTNNQNSRRNPLTPTRFLDRHQWHVTGVGFSPDGSKVASAGVDGQLYLWEAATGKCLQNYQAGSPLAGVAFSRDGTRLLARSLPVVAEGFAHSAKAGAISIWDLAGQRVRLIEIPDDTAIAPPHVKGLPVLGDSLGAAFVRDDLAVAAAVGNSIRIWETESGDLIDHLEGHNAVISAMKVDSNGSLLASADELGDVRIWNLDQPEMEEGVASFSNEVHGLALSGETGRFAILRDFGRDDDSSDGRLVPFDDKVVEICTDGQRVIPVEGAGGWHNIAVSPGRRLLAAIEPRARVAVWNFATCEMVRDFGSLKKRLNDLQTETEPWTSAARCMAFRTEDEVYLVGESTLYRLRISDDQVELVKDVPVGPSPKHSHNSYVVPGEAVMCLAFSGDGRLAALGKANGTIDVYDADSWRRITDLVSHCKDLTSLSFSVDGRRFASASGHYSLGVSRDDNEAAGQIVVWETATWQDLLTLPAVSRQEQYSGVAFDNAGRTLFASRYPTRAESRRSTGGKVLCWDTAKSPEKTPPND